MAPSRLLRPLLAGGSSNPNQAETDPPPRLALPPRTFRLSDEIGKFAQAASSDSTTAFLSRFVILQGIGLASIAALWIAGIAKKPFESAAAPMCGIILSICAIGVVCVLLRRWRDVAWIAKYVVRIGLLGTVIGLIIAFSAATTNGSTNPEDIKPMIAAVVSGMYVSLYATLMGIGTNLWLNLNLRLLGGRDG